MAWDAEVIFRVNAPTLDEVDRLHDGMILVSILAPALNTELIDALAARPITALAMDAVPRISRAQSLDVLSSMANIAGYRSVIEAANEIGRFFTGQVTAAGKVPPAKVLRRGRWRRRPCRDRRRVESRSDRLGDRPSTGSQRSSEVARGRIPPSRRATRGAAGLDRRICQGDFGGLRPSCGAPLLRAGGRGRHHHHDGPDPRTTSAATDHSHQTSRR